MAPIIRDDRGTMEIPMRLVVYVILTAAIVAVAAIGIQNLKSPMTTNIMEKQLGEISASLSTMQNGAARNLIDPASPSGNMRTFKINIPDDVEYLAFGADPDPDNDNDLTNSDKDKLTERGNVIFYKSRTGGKKRVPLDDSIEIREGLFKNGRWLLNNANNMQYGAVIRGEGKYELTFEIVYDPISKQKYTLTHFTDNVNAYIYPYDPTVLPNNILVSVYPESIPADGKTKAEVRVQLKDKKGRDAAANDFVITLTSKEGNLKETVLKTVKGRATTTITTDLVGTGTTSIEATSPKLYPGSTSLTFTWVPIIVFEKLEPEDRWIKKGCLLEDVWCDEKIERFSTKEDFSYTVSLKGYSEKEWYQTWPVAHIEIDGSEIGKVNMENEFMDVKNVGKISLSDDKEYELRITIEKGILPTGSLYVDRVILSE